MELFKWPCEVILLFWMIILTPFFYLHISNFNQLCKPNTTTSNQFDLRSGRVGNFKLPSDCWHLNGLEPKLAPAAIGEIKPTLPPFNFTHHCYTTPACICLQNSYFASCISQTPPPIHEQLFERLVGNIWWSFSNGLVKSSFFFG